MLLIVIQDTLKKKLMYIFTEFGVYKLSTFIPTNIHRALRVIQDEVLHHMLL